MGKNYRSTAGRAIVSAVVAASISTVSLSGVAMAQEINSVAVVQNEQINSVASTSFEIVRDNVRLHAILDVPGVQQNTKLPLVILMHGFTASTADSIIVSEAQALVNAGYAVLRSDFNGHGQSTGSFSDMTVSSEIADAEAVLNYAKSLPHFSKIAVAGHSQGGVVASMLAGKHPNDISALILMAPAAVLKDDAKKGEIFGTVFDPNDVPASVDVLGKSLGRSYILDAQKLKIYRTAENYTGPVCIIHGDADIVVPLSYSEKYDSRYAYSSLGVIPGADHGFKGKEAEVAVITTTFLDAAIK